MHHFTSINMQIFRKLNWFFLLAILSFSCLSASVLELPIKKINGKDYYFYKVQSNETIYSITHKLKISKEEIFKYNPSVADGLRTHETLYFPVSAYNATSNPNDFSGMEYIEHRIKKGETLYGICKKYNISKETLFAHNPDAQDGIKTGFTLKIPQQKTDILTKNVTVTNEDIENGPDIILSNDSTTVNDTIIIAQNNGNIINIAIMLPFMLNEDKPSKQALLYTEFYKGFLIALDEYKNGDNPINIYAYDTADSLELVKEILKKQELEDVNIIIAPNNDEQLNVIGNFATEHNCTVLNIFNVKNTLHTTNANVLQSNIPQDLMYKKAICYFIDTYKNHSPIFLRNKERRSDKATFISELKAQLDSSNVSYSEIAFAGTLVDDDLSKLNDSTKYVFIPMSGSRSELASVMTAITQFRNTIGIHENINLFGFPEWTTFTGNTKERMLNLNTSIYSRFYNDANKYQSIEFIDNYHKWYNEEMIDAVPAQGTLGYDTGKYIFETIQKNNGLFDATTPYDGLQHGYNFIKTPDNAGYINNTLYIIKFNPDGSVIKTLLD